ncbi:MAG: hypothetical protein SGILL_009187 [Bacillariaceae sp.]
MKQLQLKNKSLQLTCCEGTGTHTSRNSSTNSNTISHSNTMRKWQQIGSCLLFVALQTFRAPTISLAFVPPEIRQRWKDTGYSYDDAVATIEHCAETGANTVENKELFWAVKFIDRFANSNIYTDMDQRQALMDRSNGSWELRLACNSDKDEEFYPHPEFRSLATAFSCITEDYFGKGISTKDNGFCFVALGGPSDRNVKRRQVFMEYDDYFINGNQVPGWDLSYYIRGYQRNWYPAERNRPRLGFTVICTTDKVMVVRGSKTGGMAIFRKINEDMGPVAFGS